MGGTYGAAAGTVFKISYVNGRFHAEFSASLAIGLGGSGGWSFELSVEDGYHFIKHVAESVDFHYVTEITEEAYAVYKNYAFALIAEGEETLLQGANHAVNSVSNFGHWLVEKKDQLADIEKNIMGASLRQVMYQDLPPEALGQAIVTIMKIRTDEDFPVILDILESSGSDHKFKWILRVVSQMKIPEKDEDGRDKASGEALMAGIQKIEDFGLGVGYFDIHGKPQNQDKRFLAAFHALLEKNGVH